jgi:hypothetical protein
MELLGIARRVASSSASSRAELSAAWGHRDIAIAQALAPLDMDDHALALDSSSAPSFGRATEVLGKLLYHWDVAADRIGRIVAPPEIVQHALTKLSHRSLLPVTNQASPAVLPSLRHHSQAAAPATWFSRATRK